MKMVKCNYFAYSLKSGYVMSSIEEYGTYSKNSGFYYSSYIKRMFSWNWSKGGICCNDFDIME